ncbi:dapper homolog 2 [Suricata suricatta]|uniref:Dishevelled binding antagonist of beta catenin 2 n=1 Tax=Suricata suricatta TaxID=37032 RepID=A0A673U640_SURSU|nr:dapper homolog 2 [Suricata suricatta]
MQLSDFSCSQKTLAVPGKLVEVQVAGGGREPQNLLRSQDVSRKTHLGQLDRQISELQLGVRRPCGEAADGDSRPSSGFYELSDGGSCSLSASCTSVCSDRMYSSLGTLLPADPAARPRSADDTAVHGAQLPTWRPQAAEEGESRPRPVSTGDLERALLPSVALQKASTDPTPTPLLCPGMDLPAHAPDPKYQRDLVSTGGREVYPYPSPLHAVALQSPLFALPRDALHAEAQPPPRRPPPGPRGPSIPTPPVLEAGPAAAYIDRLLRLRGHGTPTRRREGEQGSPRREEPPCPQAVGVQRADSPGGRTPGRAGAGAPAQRGDASRDSLRQQGVGTPRPSRLLGGGPKPASGCVRGDTMLGPPQPRCGRTLSPRAQAAVNSQGGAVLSPARKAGGESPVLAPRVCARPPFDASGAALLGLKPGPPRTKAVKVRRGASDKALRFGAELPAGCPLTAPELSPEWGDGRRRRPTLAGVAPSRSCSEPRLYPVPFLVPLLVARRVGRGGPSQASGEARKKQRRWLSSVEVSGGPGPPRPAGSGGGGPPRPRPRPPAPRTGSESEGSERSAQCASLCPSTVAETSEDGASDHTASRFGDKESSSSDSEGGAWPGARPPQPLRAPGSRRPPLPPVPKVCRIKASKALKRKIRRFQPAALRVMTMV